MSLKDLDIPAGKYRCVNRPPGGVTLTAADVGNLKEWGSGGSAYSMLRLNKCLGCPADCPVGGLMARVVEASMSLYPNVEDTCE